MILIAAPCTAGVAFQNCYLNNQKNNSIAAKHSSTFQQNFVFYCHVNGRASAQRTRQPNPPQKIQYIKGLAFYH